ncbi:MAG: DEAD/DEAH box helicase [Succinivibrio sp.]
MSDLALIDEGLQRWMFKKGWCSLQPIQEAAVAPVLESKTDIIISASTASGKTEAAFLPAITKIAKDPDTRGIRILYISPLKALINDQYRRLDDMVQYMNLKVTPWHGDVSAGKKIKLLNDPEGILLTTPESLESLLINHTQALKSAMKNLNYVVIDEFHAFMGTQRGYQLQSQLHRLENLISRKIPRIALSATFSDANLVTAYLRPNSKVPCRVITSPKSNEDKLSVQIKGYEHTDEKMLTEDELSLLNAQKTAAVPVEYDDIANDIFRLLRGSNNLVFCNSRSATELIAARLENQCSSKHVPNEFFPHHGSLSKDLRESLEFRLQEGRWPTTAICTATLELGIDISDVASIGQIDHPMTVASLRQRLGRAGRRDHNAVLRIFLPEGITASHIELFEDTVLTVAMIELLLKRWYEPPLEHEYAFSTLLQQTLSVIASFGSASAKALYDLLCKTGPFCLCTPKIFSQFLKCLGQKDLIVQLNDGSLTLGLEGERLLTDWGFYAAFDIPKEFTIDHDGRVIGTVPLNYDLDVDTTFIFAGRGWRVNYFSAERRLIGVKPYQYDAQPLLINGSSGHIHDYVRRKMFEIYNEEIIPPYLNSVAKEHLLTGISLFKEFCLGKKLFIESPQGIALFPWRGDKVIRTIIFMLKKENIKATAYKSHIELGFTPLDTLKVAVYNLLSQDHIDPADLVRKLRNIDRDKHDAYISTELKQMAYAHNELDVDGALEYFKKLRSQL